jgi:hypothetical protein
MERWGTTRKADPPRQSGTLPDRSCAGAGGAAGAGAASPARSRGS